MKYKNKGKSNQTQDDLIKVSLHFQIQSTTFQEFLKNIMYQCISRKMLETTANTSISSLK